MWTDPGNIYIAHRHMNVEIRTETAQFPVKDYINGSFLSVCTVSECPGLVRRDWGPSCCPCSSGGPCWDSVPCWTTRPPPCLLPPPCGRAGPPSAPPEPPSQTPRNAWPPCANNKALFKHIMYNVQLYRYITKISLKKKKSAYPK
jgi:hypothetical protein